MHNLSMPFWALLCACVVAMSGSSCESAASAVPPAGKQQPDVVMPGVVSEPEEGVVVRGSDPRMLFFKKFLERSGYACSFGTDSRGLYVLAVPSDATERHLFVPYLWEHGDYAERIVLGGSDRSLAEAATGVPATVEIHIPGWERVPVTPLAVAGVRVVFSRSVLSLPFDEESLVRFFYGLRDAAYFPGDLAALYSPLFYGVPISVRVLLRSVEIVFDGQMPLSPEELFLWFYTTTRREAISGDDLFYANLLSLKIAKRLYTGMPAFLGGAVLFTNGEGIPFEEIRRHMLVEGGVAFAGIPIPYSYVWRGPRIEEQTVSIPPEQTVPVKALFAPLEGSSRSIASLVVRSADALEKRRLVVETLVNRGLVPFGELYEKMGEKDAWAAVSVVVEPSREKELFACYEQEFVPLDKTFSIGVYRVRAEER